jgi:outer membrane lipoprotein SlyB
MKRSLAATATCLAFLWVGCVTQQPWTPTVDTFNNSQSQYVHRDMEQCRALAFQVSGSTPNNAARGAVTGGLVGAAGGAALGAALGNAGRGAAVGAAAGGIGMGARAASNSEASFQQAYVNCMRQRGHNVLN